MNHSSYKSGMPVDVSSCHPNAVLATFSLYWVSSSPPAWPSLDQSLVSGCLCGAQPILLSELRSSSELHHWHLLEFRIVSQPFSITGERAVPLAFRLCCFYFSDVLVVDVPFPFCVKGGFWNSIVSVPDHCLFIYFELNSHIFKPSGLISCHSLITIRADS